MKRIAVLGMGVRGKLYADLIAQYPKRAEISAICDKDEDKLKRAREQYGLETEQCFLSDQMFFSSGKKADALLVCTQDRDHFRQTMTALDLGYDVLLEKPVSDQIDECAQVLKQAKRTGRIVAVCHELRYSAFAQTLKQIIDSKEVGELINIIHTERVGYFHQAHSYVRGNWRRQSESGPVILSKCSHDFDLLSYFTGKPCLRVSSFGGLAFFHKGNQPAGAADFCYQCNLRGSCAYDCICFYQNTPEWLERTGRYTFPFTQENVLYWLSDKENPYARCVFACDNDVADHQIVNLEFEGGVHAAFTMTGFSAERGRTISIFCTQGEITGNFETQKITVKPFGKPAAVIDVLRQHEDLGSHGGGDRGLILDFLLQLEQNPAAQRLTELSHALTAHRIALAAEHSRANQGITVHCGEA